MQDLPSNAGVRWCSNFLPDRRSLRISIKGPIALFAWFGSQIGIRGQHLLMTDEQVYVKSVV